MRTTLVSILLLISIFCMAPSNKFEPENIIERPNHFELLLISIMHVESNFRPCIVNVSEDAVGLLQIRRIYVDEANRISGLNFSYEDRFDAAKSLQMFKIVMDYWAPTYDLDTVSMVHNSGGISDDNWKSTDEYRNKVKTKYEYYGNKPSESNKQILTNIFGS